MGLNVFTLFVGFGLGSLIFGGLLQFGFGITYGLFAAIDLTLALLSLRLFRSEVPSRILRDDQPMFLESDRQTFTAIINGQECPLLRCSQIPVLCATRSFRNVGDAVAMGW